MRLPLLLPRNISGSFEPLMPATAGFIALAVPVLTVIAVCSLFTPHWETNDDVAMSMIAHGYGAIASASPKIFFSNVLWGYLVWAMPNLGGIPGYSIVTLLSLIAAGSGILYAVLRLGSDSLCAVACVVMILVHTTLTPQFTINAGILTVGAICFALAYSKLGEAHMLILALILGFAGLLVRTAEFLFVLGVALPFLPFRLLRNDSFTKLALAIFLIAAGSAVYADMLAYRGPEWQAFNELNGIRTSFTDYGVGTVLKAKPEILARYGYSASDIDLISGFFFLDPQLADPSSLRSMLDELGSRTNFASLNNAAKALSALFKGELLPLSGAVFVLTLLYRSPRHLLTILLFVAGIVMMGLLGRPGVTRIYYAPLAFLIIVPIVGAPRSPSQRSGARIVLSLALLASAYLAISKSQAIEKAMRNIGHSLPYLTETPIIAWGGAFPYSLVYPVLSRPLPIQIRSLGSFSLAPYSRLVTDEGGYANALNQIKSGAVVHFSASPIAMQKFAIYCQERLRCLPLITEDRTHSKLLNLYRVQCKPSTPSDHSQ